MKYRIIKQLIVGLFIVLSMVLLWQNSDMRDQLRQYRAAERFFVEKMRTPEECWEFKEKMSERRPWENKILTNMNAIVAAQKGDASGQCLLGCSGGLLDRDYTNIEDKMRKRESWLQAAARQGSLNHQLAIAWFYDNRIPMVYEPDKCDADRVREIERWRQQAFYWYRECALKNDAYAMYNVGIMYMPGESHTVVPDAEAAEFWLKKAQAAGYSVQSTNCALAGVYWKTNRRDEAIALLKKGAEKGEIKATTLLNRYLEEEHREAAGSAK